MAPAAHRSVAVGARLHRQRFGLFFGFDFGLFGMPTGIAFAMPGIGIAGRLAAISA